PRKSSGQVVWSGGQDMKSGGKGLLGDKVFCLKLKGASSLQGGDKEVMKMISKVVSKVVHHGGESVVAWF
ncbi:hypothetical protein Tco_1047144, partial [Tanacetum coccineum]